MRNQHSWKLDSRFFPCNLALFILASTAFTAIVESIFTGCETLQSEVEVLGLGCILQKGGFFVVRNQA